MIFLLIVIFILKTLLAYTRGRHLHPLKNMCGVAMCQTPPSKVALEAVCYFLSNIVARASDKGVVWPWSTFFFSSLFSLSSSYKNVNVYSYLIFISNLVLIFFIIIYFLLLWLIFFFDFIFIIWFHLMGLVHNSWSGSRVSKVTTAWMWSIL